MIPHHVISSEIFAALASGGGGSRAMRFLVGAQRSKHLLLLRQVVVMADRVGHPQAVALETAYDLLADAQANRPAVVEAVLRHPPVGAWAIQALRVLRCGGSLDHGYMTGLAATGVLLTNANHAVDVPLEGNCVFLPFLGCGYLTMSHPPNIATVRSTAAGGEILAGSGRVLIPADPGLDCDGWTGIRRLTIHTAGVAKSFLLDDLDPYRFPGEGTANRLDADEVGRWQGALDEAWILLVNHHPEAAAEIADAVTVLVPLRPLVRHGVSATSGDSFGAIALSQPSDGREFADTLVHECQHTKLSALLDLVTMVDDDTGRPNWYAPWRDDPRPLGALLQGAYAHLGVAGFWQKQRQIEHGDAALRAHVEFARWRSETRNVVATLHASGALTPCGVRFIEGMAKTLDMWGQEPVPVAAIERARALAIGHRTTWRARHNRMGELATNSYQRGGGSKSKSTRLP